MTLKGLKSGLRTFTSVSVRIPNSHWLSWNLSPINYACAHIGVYFGSYFISPVVSFWSTNLFLKGCQVDQNRRVFCCIQKITEMVFAKVYFFSALLAGVVCGILIMRTLKILETRPREKTRVEVDNGRVTGEGRIGTGVQESTKLEQEHDERCC